MNNKTRISKQELIEACRGSMGIAAVVCKKVGLARRTFYNCRKRWPEVQKALDDEREAGLDFAESMLMQLIKEGEFRAIAFYLERKGAERGWCDRRKVDVTTGGEPIRPVVINFGDDE